MPVRCSGRASRIQDQCPPEGGRYKSAAKYGRKILRTFRPAQRGARKGDGPRALRRRPRLPGMIHGVTVRSPCARGRIRGIHFGDGIPWDEFTIVTASGYPAAKTCVALILDDQPCLAESVVNHPEEPVLLLAHPDRYLLEEARRAVGSRSSRCRRSSRSRIRSPTRTSSGARTTSSSAIAWRRATWTRPGTTPTSSSRASTRPARRSSSTSRPTA